MGFGVGWEGQDSHIHCMPRELHFARVLDVSILSSVAFYIAIGPPLPLTTGSNAKVLRENVWVENLQQYQMAGWENNSGIELARRQQSATLRGGHKQRPEHDPISGSEIVSRGSKSSMAEQYGR